MLADGVAKLITENLAPAILVMQQHIFLLNIGVVNFIWGPQEGRRLNGGRSSQVSPL